LILANPHGSRPPIKKSSPFRSFSTAPRSSAQRFPSGNRIAEYLYDEVTETSSLIREYVWLGHMPLAVIENDQVTFIRTAPIGRLVFATNDLGVGTRIFARRSRAAPDPPPMGRALRTHPAGLALPFGKRWTKTRPRSATCRPTRWGW